MYDMLALLNRVLLSVRTHYTIDVYLWVELVIFRTRLQVHDDPFYEFGRIIRTQIKKLYYTTKVTQVSELKVEMGL